MYEIAQNNKIRNTRHYDTSNHFASENKSNNTTHTAGSIDTYSFGGRILIVDDDPDITLSFSIGLDSNSVAPWLGQRSKHRYGCTTFLTLDRIVGDFCADLVKHNI
jgi:hypothetical protein